MTSTGQKRTEWNEPTHGLKRMDLLLLGALGLVAGLLHWQALQASAFFGFPQLDERYYVAFGRALASGADLSEFGGFRPMLYPIWLGLSLKLDPRAGLITILFLQHLLWVFTALLAAVLSGWSFKSRWAGWTTGVLLILSGTGWFFAGQLLLPVLLSFLLIACFFFLALGERAVSDRTRILAYSMAGSMAGLAVQTRPNALILLPVLVLGGLLSVRQRHHRESAGYLAATVSCTMVLLIFGGLNSLQSGRFQLITGAGGINLYTGNRAGADGSTPTQAQSVTYEGEYRDSLQVYSEIAYRAAHPDAVNPDPSDISAYWVRKTLKEIRSAPVPWLGLMIRKAGLLLWNEDLPNNKSIRFFREHETPILRFYPVCWGLLLALGVPGCWIASRRRLPMAVRLSAIFLVLYAGALLLFFMNARFRLPLWPLLALGAGGFVEIFRASSIRFRGGLLLAAGGIALISFVNWTRFPLPDYGRDYYLLSKACLQKGQTVAALTAARESVRLQPENPDARFQWANAELLNGQVQQAIVLYRELLEEEPSESRIWNNLGFALEQSGQRDEALDSYSKALELDPLRSSALANRAILYFLRGDLQEFLMDLESLEAQDPNRLESLILRAVSLRSEESEAADRLYWRAVETHGEAAVRALLERLRPDHSS